MCSKSLLSQYNTNTPPSCYSYNVTLSLPVLYQDDANGALEPTEAPQHIALKDAGGCPSEFDPYASYEARDRVSRDNVVYKCKDDIHLSRFCSTAGFEPGKNGGAAAALAWDIEGYCAGTSSPTSAPNFVALENLGGCSPEWSARTQSNAYKTGDRVSKNNLIFSCKVSVVYNLLVLFVIRDDRRN